MMSAIIIPSITEDLIRKTWKWYDESLIKEPKLNAGTLVLIELMQKEAFNIVEFRSATAWPRPHGRHILQLGTGALKDSGEEIHKFAMKRLADAATEILDEYNSGDCMPRDFEPFHEPEKVRWTKTTKKRCKHNG
jgi:hypothetical protein